MTLNEWLIKKFGKPISIRKMGTEFLYICPKCKHHKLEANIKKLFFHCFRCGFKGKIQAERSAVRMTIKSTRPLEVRTLPTIPSFLTLVEARLDYPTRTEAAIRYLQSRGVDTPRMLQMKAGISLDAKYRDRVIIPIFENGIMVNYAARAVFPSMQPKELFPADVNKDDYLYGLDDVKKNDPVFIVEGIFDAEKIRSVGNKAVAVLGSQMSGIQVGKLLAKKPIAIFLMFDNDGPGDKAAIETYSKFIKRGVTPSIVRIQGPEKDAGEMDGVILKTLLGEYLVRASLP